MKNLGLYAALLGLWPAFGLAQTTADLGDARGCHEQQEYRLPNQFHERVAGNSNKLTHFR